MNWCHWISCEKLMQPEERSDSCSHKTSDSKPTSFLHRLCSLGELCEWQSFRNADAHQSSKDALVEEMCCKIHSRDCSNDQDESKNGSGQISQRSSTVRCRNRVLNDKLLNCNQHDEKKTSGNHHVTGRRSRWCFTSPFSLIKCRTSEWCVNFCFVNPPVWSIFRQKP